MNQYVGKDGGSDLAVVCVFVGVCVFIHECVFASSCFIFLLFQRNDNSLSQRLLKHKQDCGLFFIVW